MKHWILIVSIVGLAVVAGCAGQPDTSDDGSAAAYPVESGTAGAGVAVTGDARELNLVDDRTVFFGFDSSALRPGDVAILELHAKNLVGNPSLRLRIEGHTDERGSREYNIGLGESRSQSARSALLVRGVSADQLTTISYGEERPADSGSNEAAWARNRRVEMVYGN